MLPRRVRNELDRTRRQRIVVVEETDPRAARDREPGIGRDSNASVAFVTDDSNIPRVLVLSEPSQRLLRG